MQKIKFTSFCFATILLSIKERIVFFLVVKNGCGLLQFQKFFFFVEIILFATTGSGIVYYCRFLSFLLEDRNDFIKLSIKPRYFTNYWYRGRGVR